MLWMGFTPRRHDAGQGRPGRHDRTHRHDNADARSAQPLQRRAPTASSAAALSPDGRHLFARLDEPCRRSAGTSRPRRGSTTPAASRDASSRPASGEDALARQAVPRGLPARPKPVVASRSMTGTSWPALRVEDWTATRETLHRWTQIVGKVRLAQAPMLNHWWQVTLYVTPRGLTTSSMPAGDRDVRDRVRLLRASAPDHRRRRRPPRDRAGAQDRGGLLRRVHGRARVAGPGHHDLARPGRDRARDPVRSGHRARQLRPRGGAAVLAPARAGRPRPERVPRAASPARSAPCTSSGAPWTWP